MNISNLPLSLFKVRGIIRNGAGKSGCSSSSSSAASSSAAASATSAPDTFAVITTSEHYNYDDNSDNISATEVWGETEVVKASYNPQYTTTIPFEYEYTVSTPTNTSSTTTTTTTTNASNRANVTFYIHVFRQFSNRTVYRYGTAQFNVLDLISSKRMIRMKRLRDTNSTVYNKNSKYINTGCVYCQFERVFCHNFHYDCNGDNLIQQQHINHNSHYNQQQQEQLLVHLQLQALDLIPRRTKRNTGSTSDVANTGLRNSSGSINETSDTSSDQFNTADLLDTILEIAKPMHIDSTTQQPDSGWIVVHRSAPVLASLNPLYDTVCLHIEDFYHDDSSIGIESTYDSNHHNQKRYDQPIRISIYSIRKKNSDCRRHNLVGVTETTLRQLLSLPSNDDQCDDDTINHHKNQSPYLILQRSTAKLKEVGKLQIHNATVCDLKGNQIHHSILFNRHNESITTSHSIQPETKSQLSCRTTIPCNVVQQHDVTDQYTGCQIHLCVAIDYTSTNGYPYDPNSYHYHSATNSLNDYEETIVTVGNALFGCSNHNCNRSSIPVWGFGAKYDGTVRHIFQCGPTPTVDGVGGVLDAYQSVFQSDFIMSGPTIFTQVLQAAASKAKRLQDTIQERTQYVILLVITDGVMDNYDETLERLHIYRTVPLSVIFVCIGRCDFSKLYHLCNNHHNQKCVNSGDSEQMSRPMVTVVEFRQHQHDILSLGDAAICNIPFQINRYMDLQHSQNTR